MRFASVIALLAALVGCASSSSSGYLSIHARRAGDQVQVLAYFLRPSQGSAGYDILENLGCTNRTVAQRLATVRGDVSYASAGGLTIEPHGGAPILVPVDGLGTYGAMLPLFFAPDQSVTVRFDGAVAPRFAHTLMAPPRIDWLEPVCRPAPSRRCASFDRTRDLVVRWTPAPHGRVRVELRGNGRVACAFDARAGAGVVPQALLPAGAIDMTVVAEEYAKVTAGQSELHVELDAPYEERDFAAP